VSGVVYLPAGGTDCDEQEVPVFGQYLVGPQRALPVLLLAPVLLQYPLATAPGQLAEPDPPLEYRPALHSRPEGLLDVDPARQ